MGKFPHRTWFGANRGQISHGEGQRAIICPPDFKVCPQIFGGGRHWLAICRQKWAVGGRKFEWGCSSPDIFSDRIKASTAGTGENKYLRNYWKKNYFRET